mgnify:FL=1
MSDELFSMLQVAAGHNGCTLTKNADIVSLTSPKGTLSVDIKAEALTNFETFDTMMASLKDAALQRV